jgi:hypothetical protein
VPILSLIVSSLEVIFFFASAEGEGDAEEVSDVVADEVNCSDPSVSCVSLGGVFSAASVASLESVEEPAPNRPLIFPKDIDYKREIKFY